MGKELCIFKWESPAHYIRADNLLIVNTYKAYHNEERARKLQIAVLIWDRFWFSSFLRRRGLFLVGCDICTLRNVTFGSALVELSTAVWAWHVIGIFRWTRRRQIRQFASSGQVILNFFRFPDIVQELLMFCTPVRFLHLVDDGSFISRNTASRKCLSVMCNA